MSALENEINRSLSNGFWGVWFHENHMLGDSVLTALEKMKQTDQQKHSDSLLQEFYAKTQKHNEPIEQYVVRLDMAAGKVRLQSQEALGGTPEEWGRLLVDCLLQSMNPKLQARVAHLVNGKAVHQRPAYYQLIKFAVEKEAEINFDKAKNMRDSTLKPKAITHFCFNNKKSMLPATPAVRMVAPAPEEGSGEGEATPLLSKESNSGEYYEVTQEDATISQGDVEIAVRVAQASEAFTGQCFRCNKVGHRFHDEECEMYDPKFLNSSRGPTKNSKGRQAPRMKGPSKTMGMKANC